MLIIFGIFFAIVSPVIGIVLSPFFFGFPSGSDDSPDLSSFFGAASDAFGRADKPFGSNIAGL